MICKNINDNINKLIQNTLCAYLSPPCCLIQWFYWVGFGLLHQNCFCLFFYREKWPCI